MVEVVTSDNWNDPVLNWWRDYFGGWAMAMLPGPTATDTENAAEPFAVFDRPDDRKLIWSLSRVRSPFSVDHEADEPLVHYVLVGRELDYTHVLFPAKLKEEGYETELLLQRQWLYFGWYKDRGATERVVWCNWNLNTFHPVTYEELRRYANRLMAHGISWDDLVAEWVVEAETDVWIPGVDELKMLLEADVEFD